MQEYQDKRTLVGHTLLLRRVGLNVNDVTDSVVDKEGGDVGGTVLYRLQYSPKKSQKTQSQQMQVQHPTDRGRVSIVGRSEWVEL